MRNIGAPLLTMLDIGVCGPFQWRPLFQIISENLRGAPLSSLHFSVETTLDDIGGNTVDDIRFLYIFPNMTNFRFTALSGLDDIWIEEMATAWPHLSNLRVGTLFPRDHTFSQVTVRGLAFLVQQCQKLSSLHLRINGATIGSSLGSGGRPNELIRTISLAYSPVGDVTEVATVLARAIPNLLTITFCGGTLYSEDDDSPSAVNARRWKEVETLVREIRGQENMAVAFPKKDGSAAAPASINAGASTPFRAW
jgi:hypothetical protein